MKRGCGWRGWANNSVNRAPETRSTRTEFGVEDVNTALRAAAARLAAVSDTARLDAELLMAHALGVERAVLLLDPSRFRSEEHTSELQSLMRISYAGFCLKKKKK